MAALQNDRDLLLQAASPRVVPPAPLEIGDIVGLPGRLDGIDLGLSTLGGEVNHLMNNSGDLIIRSSTTTLTDSNTVTLTAVRKNGLTGAVLWSIFAGSTMYSTAGDVCTIHGADVTSASITVKAEVGSKEAYATIAKLGALSGIDRVDLASQVTGQLASGKVTGLGALALLNAVDLNTQTIGALNALTQVSGLGGLAYLSQVQAGTSQVAGFGALAQKDKASASADVTGLGALALKSTAAAGTDVTGLGALALQNSVNLSSQVTGSLGVGSVAGLGSLATQNSVNGYTQVTNLGNLAYANAIAANQIGAGQLAAGVVYAGRINAEQINAGIITGSRLRTAASGARTEIFTEASWGGGSSDIICYDSNNNIRFRVAPETGNVCFARGSGDRGCFVGEQSAAIPAAQMRNAGTGAGLLGINTSSGPGLEAESASGPALLTKATSGPDIQMTAKASKPAHRPGSVAYTTAHGFIFCYPEGWFRLAPSALVAV